MFDQIHLQEKKVCCEKNHNVTPLAHNVVLRLQ